MDERSGTKVFLSPRFLRELKARIDWIAQESSNAAAAAETRVRVAVRRLASFPELGRPGRIAETRELSVPRTRFVIAYRYDGEKVEIAALRHSSQQWPAEL